MIATATSVDLPRLRISDEMIERAARALAEEVDGQLIPATEAMWEQAARRAVHAAFDAVPLTNFGIGLALQVFDRVICVKGTGFDAEAGVFVRNGDPNGFDGLPHTMSVQLKRGERGPFLRTLRFTMNEPPAPGEQID